MSSILIAHIIGGFISIAVIGWSLVGALVKKGSPKFMIAALLSSVIFQILTGFLLIIIEPNVSIVAVCYKGLVLLSFTGIAIYAVNYRFSIKTA
jgi:heme A synthase